MDRKKLIIIACVIVLIVSIIITRSAFNKTKNQTQTFDDNIEIANSEYNELIESLENTLKQLTSVRSVNDEITIQEINLSFNDFSFNLIDNINTIDFFGINIYDENGTKINDISNYKLGKYTNDISAVKANTSYLCRLWSYETKNTYYCIINVGSDFNIKPTLLWYTENQNDTTGKFIDYIDNNEN